MNCWLDRIQIWCVGSLGISDNLFDFWKKIFENKIADGGGKFLLTGEYFYCGNLSTFE